MLLPLYEQPSPEGGPNETLKDSENSMIGAAALDESTVSVMLGSNMGPSTKEKTFLAKWFHLFAKLNSFDNKYS